MTVIAPIHTVILLQSILLYVQALFKQFHPLRCNEIMDYFDRTRLLWLFFNVTRALLPLRCAMAYYLEAETFFVLWLDTRGMTFLHKLPILSSYTGSVRIAINGLRMFASSVDSAIPVTGK